MAKVLYCKTHNAFFEDGFCPRSHGEPCKVSTAEQVLTLDFCTWLQNNFDRLLKSFAAAALVAFLMGCAAVQPKPVIPIARIDAAPLPFPLLPPPPPPPPPATNCDATTVGDLTEHRAERCPARI